MIGSFFENINNFRIPTLLGLSVILIGVGAGVFLVLNGNQSLTTQASPDQTPQNITFTNQEANSMTISWQTLSDVPGFITFGINSPNEQTILDDRDSGIPTSRRNHHVSLKKLEPQTSYKFKIVSGKFTNEASTFTTPSSFTEQNNFKPIIGSVLNGPKELEEGIVYLSIPDSSTQSTVIKNFGNFIIPISKILKEDLSGISSPDGSTIAKLTVLSKDGQASATFKLQNSHLPIGPLKIGQSLDLTNLSTPPPTSVEDLALYDLDNNLIINSADYATILNSFGRNPKNIKADINKDRVVDQKDLELMAAKITSLGIPLEATPSSTNKTVN